MLLLVIKLVINDVDNVEKLSTRNVDKSVFDMFDMSGIIVSYIASYRG